jgi:hypothetical protein
MRPNQTLAGMLDKPLMIIANEKSVENLSTFLCSHYPFNMDFSSQIKVILKFTLSLGPSFTI